VSFSLFGFPVSIHASFLVVVLFLGYSARTGVSGALVWLVVVTVSVIAHELGHAALAAPVGGEPRIDLYGMAGLTRWNPARAGRGRQVAVSVAGPAFGLALGIAMVFLRVALDPAPGTLAATALDDAVFANVGWGLLNLLPMLPLDGGNVVRSLMPGDDLTRLRRASYLSLGTAAVLVLFLMSRRAPFLAIFVVFLAAGNVQNLGALRRVTKGDPYADRLRGAEAAIESGDGERALALLPEPEHAPAAYVAHVTVLRAMALLRAGRAREAQETLLDLPAGGRVDPTFGAAVLLANGQERLAREHLAHSLPAAPGWAVRELAALLVRRGEPLDLDGVSPAGMGGVATALFRAERFAEAAEWGERALRAGVGDPAVAYNVACAWSRAGDPDRALRALDEAAQYGWADLARADNDPDLATARTGAAYVAVRQRIAANGGLGQPSAPG
jgi:Zn-dependent protease